MTNRTRTHRNEVYLDDEEQFILEAKFKESKMKSKSAFLRKLIFLDLSMMWIIVICEITTRNLDESVKV